MDAGRVLIGPTERIASPVAYGDKAIVTRYQAGARWRACRLSAGEGALGLIAHAIAPQRDPPGF